MAALTRKSFATALLAAILFAAAAPTTLAQNNSTRIAVVDVQKAFNDLDERRALEAAMVVSQEELEKEAATRQAALRSQLNDLQILNAESQQYQDAQLELERATIEFRVWADTQQARLQRQQALHLENLYKGLITNIATVAQEDGFDLVLQKDDSLNLTQKDQQALTAMIVQRKVLFAADNIDITQRVIAAANNTYNIRRSAQR